MTTDTMGRFPLPSRGQGRRGMGFFAALLAVLFNRDPLPRNGRSWTAGNRW